jgi:hypothetical protein
VHLTDVATLVLHSVWDQLNSQVLVRPLVFNRHCYVVEAADAHPWPIALFSAWERINQLVELPLAELYFEFPQNY